MLVKLQPMLKLFSMYGSPNVGSYTNLSAVASPKFSKKDDVEYFQLQRRAYHRISHMILC